MSHGVAHDVRDWLACSSIRKGELTEAPFVETFPLSPSNRKSVRRSGNQSSRGTTSNTHCRRSPSLFAKVGEYVSRSAILRLAIHNDVKVHGRGCPLPICRQHIVLFVHCWDDWTSKPYLRRVSATAAVLMNDKNSFAVSLFFDELRMTHACSMGG